MAFLPPGHGGLPPGFLCPYRHCEELQYDLRYRFSADVDWCIRVMQETERLGLSLQGTDMVVANYLDEGATTKNHKASLRERYLVMQRHYGAIQTFLLHCWFAVRQFISPPRCH